MVATGQSMEFLRISPIFPMAKKKTRTHEHLKFEPLDNILSIPPSPFAFCSHQSKCMNINT